MIYAKNGSRIFQSPQAGNEQQPREYAWNINIYTCLTGLRCIFTARC